MKKTALLLALTGLLSCSLVVPGTEANGSEEGNRSLNSSPVELLYAKAGEVNVGSYQYLGFINGFVEVDNIAFEKQLTIHYTLDGENWSDLEAHYFAPTSEGREKWSFSLSVFQVPYGTRASVPASNMEFAIKYEVAGWTFWDNNNGLNYHVSSYGRDPLYALGDLGRTSILLVRRKAVLNGWPAYANSYFLTALVQNWDSQKTVTMVGTYDNWETITTPALTFSRSLIGGVEEWAYSGLAGLDVKSIQLALVMGANGIEYWDNNQGFNYILPIPGEY